MSLQGPWHFRERRTRSSALRYFTQPSGSALKAPRNLVFWISTRKLFQALFCGLWLSFSVQSSPWLFLPSSPPLLFTLDPDTAELGCTSALFPQTTEDTFSQCSVQFWGSQTDWRESSKGPQRYWIVPQRSNHKEWLEHLLHEETQRGGSPARGEKAQGDLF